MYKSRVGLTISLLSSSTLATTRGLRPALFLDFLSGSLDSRVGFSRGTNATMVDSTGRIVYAPANMITNSVGPASSTGVTASTATGAAPDGTNAVRLTKTDATSPRYAGWNAPFTAQSNTRYVASAYFKYDGYDTTVSLEYNNVVHWGGTAWVAPFNVTASGITTDVPANCTSGVQAIGNGWFRVWAAFTTGTVSSAVTSILTRITGASGVTVLTAWGQLEPVTYQTAPGPYAATTASAYYGPRFDYNPFTLGALGLLIEEQRTNLLTYSEQFDNAAWIKDTATITPNTTVAPDGTTTADTLTGVSGSFRAYQTATTVVSTTYTMSVYVKQGTSPTIGVDFINVAAGPVYTFATNTWSTVAGWTTTAQNAGNDWVRLTASIAATVTNAGPGWRVSGATTAFIWGAQLEAGAFATSYIPTVASQVTRNADVATMTGTNFSGWYNQTEGTFVADFDTPQDAAKFVVSASDGTNNNRIQILPWSARQGQIVTGGVDQALFDNGTISLNTPTKIALAYATNNAALSLLGGSPATDATVSLPTVDRLLFGNATSGTDQTGGHLRQLAYFNTRLPNAQLETLSSPSLVPTLALDFTASSYASGY